MEEESLVEESLEGSVGGSVEESREKESLEKEFVEEGPLEEESLEGSLEEESLEGSVEGSLERSVEEGALEGSLEDSRWILSVECCGIFPGTGGLGRIFPEYSRIFQEAFQEVFPGL